MFYCKHRCQRFGHYLYSFMCVTLRERETFNTNTVDIDAEIRNVDKYNNEFCPILSLP